MNLMNRVKKKRGIWSKKNKKGDIWISAVLYVLVIAAVIALIIKAGIPILNKVKDNGVFTKSKDSLSGVDKYIKEVASEGPGSQRVVTVDLDGDLLIDSDEISLELDTKSKLVEPRSSVKQGDVIVFSGATVKATAYPDSFLLQNNRILVNISRLGNSTKNVSINTSKLINYIQVKENNARALGSLFSFYVGKDNSSKKGTGYTELLNNGDDLGFATVIAHVNSTAKNYDLYLTLEPEADYLIVDVKNLKFKP